MRLLVSEQGYASAVEALVSGNELAAQAATRLAGRLRGYAGMAGDDSTATDFAASYDEAAAATVAALESTVGAFGTLGRMVEASLGNHAHAEARSTLPGWARAVTGPRTVADRAVGVLLATPPSSLGADSGGPGGPAGFVLDLLQDVFWPNADTGRVRAAAAAWTVAGETVGLLSAHCDSALAALDGERSPEIPLAVAVIRDVRDRVDDLSTRLGALGAACSDYADHVDAKRGELRDLLEDLVEELAIGAIIAGGLTFLSGGAAAGAAGTAGAARIAAASSKARGILDGLRVLTSGPALSSRSAAATAGEISATTERIHAARVILTEGKSTTRVMQQRPGWLTRHEHSGSHTMGEHVAQSRSDLLFQLEVRGKKSASTFPDVDSAEGTLSNLIEAHQGRVQAWLEGSGTRLRLDGDMGYITGQTMDRTGAMSNVTGVRAVLQRDATMPSGWRLLTGFPQP
ncbi:RNase A-like domain-containing protein [Nocardioides conyzicola]|uniref:Bacterial CdiA-CT RNAse A domain-containing protein n=1 Tax=Nocardioides conyzicola TaxID=1651781 RepID=A0ABP8X1W3_9ACTN